MKSRHYITIKFLLFINIYAFNESVAPYYNKDLPLFFVPIVKATPESVKGYGTIVYPPEFESYKVTVLTWPAPGWRPVQPGTGNEGGTTQGLFNMKWENGLHYAHNHAVNGNYFTGWYYEKIENKSDGNSISLPYVITLEANYHPDGGQLVVPLEQKPFVALLALPGDDVTPESFRAFYFDGSFGIEIATGVWHQPFFSIHESMKFADRQGKVHACIAVDFPKEFGCYMAVPLFLD